MRNMPKEVSAGVLQIENTLATEFMATAQFSQLHSIVDQAVKQIKLQTFMDRGVLTTSQQEAGVQVRRGIA